MTATHDIILSTLSKIEGGIPEHIGTIVLDIAGIFTEHDVETLTSRSIDGITGEPTHTCFMDECGVVHVFSIGSDTSLSSSATQFVDRSMTTDLETTGVTL